MKRHNLKSSEIKRLYDALFRYELFYYQFKKTATTDNLIPALAAFLDEQDIYLGRNLKSEIAKTNGMTGFFLYNESLSPSRVFWLYKHIRDAFAHGGIIRSKKKKIVKFKEKQKTLTGVLTDSQFNAFLSCLPT